MHIFRFRKDRKFCLGIELNSVRYDLSLAAPEFSDISTWLAVDDPVGAVLNTLDKIANFSLEEDVEYCLPLDTQEIWASGVTYFRSRVARMEESETGSDYYDLVYDAQRPELFFKSNATRAVAHGEPVRIRRDSSWNVPEPELVLVLSKTGRVIGYTIGNDVSSRSIEGENPLYLPQAKVYDGSCSIGPRIAVNIGDDGPRAIEMTITRGGSKMFEGQTSTAQMRRTEEELAEFLFREMSFNDGVFLLTGTGIVPPDDFTLASGDIVSISIEGIGTLENPVA